MGETSTSGLDSGGFEHRIRVYWEDTDAGGIVFYANYLKFFERARTEWLRAAGIEQQALRDTTGLIFVVAETQVRYLRPARLDDLLHVTVVVREQGRASMQLFQQAWRLASPPELLAEGEIRIGCVDAATLQPKRFPLSLIQALNA
jgi:acyl-CoA thioester hydrolase